jgi:alkanesulfonate monooxygenase SsuD/methylene tetrahydromethanopterin reductase-like flavin-dependent oxidoreductase (luciferase family)
MRHALHIPAFGSFAAPDVVLDLARAAEAGGWDGFFLWDHIARPHEPQRAEVADPWILLAAVATVTERIRLGPMVTPLARRRPQKVARESVTLDHLSGGRLVLGVGLGVNSGGELTRFGELDDPRERAAAYDEALALLQELWSGEEVDHHGDRYTAGQVTFLPRPVQEPRIPLWGAAWGGGPLKPVRRAARLDGLFPVNTTVDQLRPMLDVVAAERGGLDGYEVAIETEPGTDLDALASLGATWIMRPVDDSRPPDEVIAAVEAGPAGPLAG